MCTDPGVPRRPSIAAGLCCRLTVSPSGPSTICRCSALRAAPPNSVQSTRRPPRRTPAPPPRAGNRPRPGSAPAPGRSPVTACDSGTARSAVHLADPVPDGLGVDAETSPGSRDGDRQFVDEQADLVGLPGVRVDSPPRRGSPGCRTARSACTAARSSSNRSPRARCGGPVDTVDHSPGGDSDLDRGARLGGGGHPATVRAGARHRARTSAAPSTRGRPAAAPRPARCSRGRVPADRSLRGGGRPPAARREAGGVPGGQVAHQHVLVPAVGDDAEGPRRSRRRPCCRGRLDRTLLRAAPRRRPRAQADGPGPRRRDGQDREPQAIERLDEIIEPPTR